MVVSTDNDDGSRAKKGNFFQELFRAIFGSFPLKFEGSATEVMDKSRIVDNPKRFIEPMTASKLRRTGLQETQTRQEFVDTFMEKYLPYVDRHGKDCTAEEAPHQQNTALDLGGASAASDTP